MTAALMKESGLSRGRRDAPLLINDRIRKEVCRKASDSPELHQRERGRGREKESGKRRKNRKIIVWLLRTNPCLHKEVGVLL